MHVQHNHRYRRGVSPFRRFASKLRLDLAAAFVGLTRSERMLGSTDHVIAHETAARLARLVPDVDAVHDQHERVLGPSERAYVA